MPYCQKCGNKVEENMTFCPRCGASLKDQTQPYSTQAPPPTYRRREEKQEKNEKNEHGEKREKQEKGEFGYIGFLIGGLVLIVIGLFSVLQFTGFIQASFPTFAIVLLLIGIVIIILAVYATTTARKRNPHSSTM